MAPFSSSILEFGGVTQEIEDEGAFTDIREAEGNDTLEANEIEFGNQTKLDGGGGDDVLQSDLYFLGNDAPNGSFDTFMTRAGADRIGISYLNVRGGGATMGLIGRVTDFDVEADVILIDPRWFLSDLDADQSTDITETLALREDPDGAYTDIDFTHISVATGEDVTGTLRLDGVTAPPGTASPSVRSPPMHRPACAMASWLGPRPAWPAAPARQAGPALVCARPCLWAGRRAWSPRP